MNPHEPAYFDRLIARYDQAVFVPRGEFADGEVGQCHENADRYAALHPGHAAVRGWLIIQLGGAPQFLIHAHSVVRREDDALLDVTPTEGTDGAWHLFLEHEGSRGIFSAGEPL
jgi:hypothetical protein